MSRFTNYHHLIPPHDEESLFTLAEPLEYERYFKWSWQFIIIPAWTKTNFASLPWLLTLFIKPYDRRIALAAILHDALWTWKKTIKEYQEANDIFFEAMWVCGASLWIRVPFYIAVSISKYFYFLFYYFKKSV